MPYGNLLHNWHPLTAKQKPHRKAHLLTRNNAENISEKKKKKSGEWAYKQKKEKIERAMGVGREKQERR